MGEYGRMNKVLRCVPLVTTFLLEQSDLLRSLVFIYSHVSFFLIDTEGAA
jgi:hypothetical protein